MAKDWRNMSPDEKKKFAAQLQADIEKEEADLPVWFDGKKADEVAYCENLMTQHEMRSINNRIYTMDGLIEDEKMKAAIAEDLKCDLMETIRNVEINQLHDFKNHPFKVEVNTELCELMKSIEKEGVLVPLFVRTNP